MIRNTGTFKSTKPTAGQQPGTGPDQVAQLFFDWCEQNRTDRDPRNGTLLETFMKGMKVTGLPPVKDVRAALARLLESTRERSASAA